MPSAEARSYSARVDSLERLDRRGRRLPGLPPPGGVARAGGGREAGRVPRRRLLGSAGARLRRPAALVVVVGSRAGRPRRQPHRPHVHRRPVGRVALPRRCAGPASPTSPRASAATTASSCTGAYITAPVRCAPPANKPTPDERDRCRPFLERELALLDRARVLRRARASSATRCCAACSGVRPRPKFGHGVEVAARAGEPARTLLVLVPREPAEHLHRAAHRADARRRVPPGARPRRRCRLTVEAGRTVEPAFGPGLRRPAHFGRIWVVGLIPVRSRASMMCACDRPSDASTSPQTPTAVEVWPSLDWLEPTAGRRDAVRATSRSVALAVGRGPHGRSGLWDAMASAVQRARESSLATAIADDDRSRPRCARSSR